MEGKTNEELVELHQAGDQQAIVELWENNHSFIWHMARKLSAYAEAEDLINIGAYKNGSNKEIDYAISKNAAVNEYLLQRTDEKYEFEQEVEMLKNIFVN